MDNKLHYAHTFFCGHLAAVGRASEVQAADKRWQAEKPLTREAYERLSSIYYESFIDSLMQVDGQTSGAVYADTAHLTLTGNKLKCFQIFILDDFSDELLFELGTLSPVGCVADHKHEYSPSQEYYDRIIRTHTISAFRNWKALALVDSFTVVAKGRTAAQMWVWPNSYFRLIYIHALYQKTLLFVVNRQFRSAANDRKSIRLLHKMKEQEHWYAFSNISYNFLPQLIYRAIDTGLDIAIEREQLHRHLEQEAERLEKNSERRLAGLILFLTMLTVCSATYDGASLVKDYFGWESGTTPFRIFAALLLSAIVITSISVWHYRRNKS